MKVLLMTLLLGFSNLATAMDTALLRCLGAEEKSLHLKKNMGPIYELNQRMIAEVVQIPNVKLKTIDFHDVCSRKRPSETLHLLQITLLKGKEIFEIPESVTGMQKQITIGMIDDYVDACEEIFINFISQIQTSAPTPDCLTKEFPELTPFFYDVKYLQEDVEIKRIFHGRENKIFTKLLTYTQAFKRCQARLDLKKKAKPSSTPAPKKR
jgi:hypothetical protein